MPAIDRSESYADLMHLVVGHGATIYVTDMAEKPAMNRVWQAFLDPVHLPARAHFMTTNPLGRDARRPRPLVPAAAPRAIGRTPPSAGPRCGARRSACWRGTPRL